MSELRTRLLIEAETRNAQAALRATERDLGALGERARAAAREGEGIARTFEAAAGGLAGIQRQAAPAAGAVGNLVAQFNDVGQMLLAGQSPLLLAVQQGSQIAQVLGPLGAAGAVRALGAAFAGLLSPVNLAVLAVTAGVAALGQWGIAALSVRDAGADLSEILEELAQSVRALDSAAQAAGVPLEQQIARYGRLADAVRAALAAELDLATSAARTQVGAAAEALALPRLDRGRLEADSAARAEQAALAARLAGLEAERSAAAAAGAAAGELARIEEEIARVDLALSSLDAGGAMAELSSRLGEVARRLGVSGEAARDLALALADLDAAAAEGPAATAEAAAAALEALRAAFEGGFEGADENALALGRSLAALARQAADAARLTGEAGAEAGAAVGRAAATAKSRLDELARLRQELIGRQLGLPEDARARALAAREFEARTPLPRDATADQRRAWEEARERAAAYAEELVRVRAELRALEGAEWAASQIAAHERRAEIAAIEARHGRDSAEATIARAAAERASLAAQAEARGVAGELLRHLLDSWQAAAGLAGVDLASPIAAARVEAQNLAGALAAALAGAAAGLADLDRRLEVSRLKLSTAGRPVDQARAVAALEFERNNPLPDLSALPDGQRAAGLAEWSRLRAETIAKAAELARLDAAAAERLRSAFSGSGGGGGGGGGGGRSGGGVAALAPELAELERILSGLPLKAAQVGERVRAGLMSAAEGGAAMRDAARLSAEALADLIPRLEALGPAGETAVERARAALDDLAGEIGGPLAQALEQAASGVGGALEDVFVDLVTTGRASAGALVDAILAEFARLAYLQFVEPLVAPLLEGLFGGLGSLFGLAAADGAVVVSGAVAPYARGGVPGLEKYRDRVVDRPVLFGLMGEAGAEAILPLAGSAAAPAVRAILPDGGEGTAPLARIGGRLGVDLAEVAAFARGGVPGWVGPALRTAGAGPSSPAAAGRAAAAAPIVHIHNHASRDVDAGVRAAEQDGQWTIEVLVERVEDRLAQRLGRGLGPLNAALGGLYGVRRAGRW